MPGRPRPPRRESLAPARGDARRRSLFVRNAIDRAVPIVRDEQGAVAHDEQVDWTTPEALAFEDAAQEDLGLRIAVRAKRHPRHVVAALLRAVPRAVLRDEDIVAILRRKHLAVVEPHPERSDVRPELHYGFGELAAAAVLAELWIERVALMAGRVTELQACRRRSVALVAPDGGL